MPFAFLLLALLTVSQPIVIVNAQDLTSNGKTSPQVGESHAVCPDVPPKHWAFSAVKKIYESGIVEGRRNGFFEGDKPLTRVEFIVTMARFSANIHTFLTVPLLSKQDLQRGGSLTFRPDAKGGKEYSDVPQSHWAYEALRRLSTAGIIRGLPDGTLGANAPLSRYDYAVALERMVAFSTRDSYYFEQLENPQAAAPPWEPPMNVAFKDVPNNHRAYRAIIRLWSVGVFQGDTETSFHGSRPLTRYEFATSMSRLLDLRGPYID